MICEQCGRSFTANQNWERYFYPLEEAVFLLCPQCQQEWQRVDEMEHCPYCGQWKEVTVPCECEHWRQLDSLFCHQSLYCYNRVAKEWLNRYKIQGDYALRYVISEAVKQKLAPYRNEIIVPIPLDRAKYHRRGFNQVEGVLQAADLEYQSLLVKSTSFGVQGLKTREERLRLPQPFAVKKALDAKQCYLLVDDIYTTGRTITHAYQALKSAGAQRIHSFSYLRA